MKLLSGAILVICLSCLTFNTKAQLSINAYIDRYKDLSVKMMHDYCIPASVILAVAIIESGACNSKNCKLLNNHFGIKTKKKYRIPGTKKYTSYKYYESDTASYMNFCEWIMKKKLYQEICGVNDYSVWAKLISRSGYTRSSANWKRKVLLTIKKYGLYQYDEECIL